MTGNKTLDAKSDNNKEKQRRNKLLWNEAIRDLEARINTAIENKKAAESEISKLESALRTFKGNHDRSYPWPGNTKVAETQD